MPVSTGIVTNPGVMQLRVYIQKAVRAFKSLTHFGARQIYGIG